LIRAEPFDRPATAVPGPGGQVLLQVCLAESLPGPVRQGGDAVRGQAEDGRHRGRAVPLDLGVPEDHLPALGQLGEGACGERPLQPLDRRVDERHASVVPGQIVSDLEPLVAPGPVVERVPEAGQQVGAERGIRAAALLQLAEHLRERLGYQIVGVGGVAHQRAGQPPGSVEVSCVELAERCGIASACRRDEIHVAGTGWRGSRLVGEFSWHLSTGRQFLCKSNRMILVWRTPVHVLAELTASSTESVAKPRHDRGPGASTRRTSHAPPAQRAGGKLNSRGSGAQRLPPVVGREFA
jgi:hypothetical protein